MAKYFTLKQLAKKAMARWGRGSSLSSSCAIAGSLCSGGTTRYDMVRLAGVFLSSMTALSFRDLTRTTTRLGFRRFTLMISPKAWLTDAEKRPVRRLSRHQFMPLSVLQGLPTVLAEN